MKEIYTAPEMEIITFAAEDVITSSITGGGDYGDFGGDGEIQLP
jgi:hypothetical protein